MSGAPIEKNEDAEREEKRAAEVQAVRSRAIDEVVDVACIISAKLRTRGYSAESASNASGFLAMAAMMALDRHRY